MMLPPLNALRAFEAAARAGGYVAAARELGVSPAAVSQQVRNLERYLDKRLFTRFNNRIQLTDAGRAVFAGTSAAFQSLADLTTRTTAGPARRRLVISVLQSVAGRWLGPRLAAYQRAHPDLRFALRVEEDPVDFGGAGIDLRLCYGTNLYPELASRPLRHDQVLPLCSPAYRAAHPDLAQVPDDDLIHTDWGPGFGSHPGWDRWFDAEGPGARPAPGTGFVVGTSGLALDMAREGLGVALGQRMLAEADLASGALVALSDRALPLGHGYCLIWPQGRARRGHLHGLIDWLTDP